MSSSSFKMTDLPIMMIEKPSWWKRRTNMERNLTLVIGGILLVSSFLALSTLYLYHSCDNTESLTSISNKNHDMIRKPRSLYQNTEYENNNTICLTAGCIRAAATVIRNMDLSVDPCDDFYQFACGNFKKNSVIYEQKSQSSYTLTDNSMRRKLLMIVSEPIQPNEQKPLKMAKLLYKSCMDKENIKNEDLGAIKEILKSLGGWPVIEGEIWNDTEFTWMESVYNLRLAGLSVDYFFSFNVDIDIKNRTRRIIVLDQASLGLKHEHLVNGISNEYVNAYYEYMIDIAEMFGAYRPWAAAELGNSLDFEVELAKISLSEEERQDATMLYNPMKISDLQQKFPSIPWQEYMNKMLNPLTIQQDEIIIVTSPKYLSDLETLLSNTPKRVQANYVFWKVIMDTVEFLTEELRERKLDIVKILNEIDTDTLRKPRWKECFDNTYLYFKFAIMSTYIRKFVNENDKKNVLEMVKRIKEEKYKLLSSVDWLDDETRKHAIDKVKFMTDYIAYPDELLDDSKLNAFYENLEVDNKYDYFTSMLNVGKFYTDLTFSLLRQPVNKSNWIFHSNLADVNSYNILEENSIDIPVGILQDIFFSSDRPQFMNYGGIGTIIGHEINHGFDTMGITYDKQGDLVNWWSEEAKNRYLEKAMCILNQYKNYMVREVGLKLNSSSTQDENIADNIGYKEAYNAYNVWAKQHGVEPRLPGLQDYTPQQMFWVSAANVWCSEYSLERLKYLIINDSHSPDRFRIIGSFSNLKEFSEDFQCKLGSYMNPVKKCQMW
ncbi:neprilysin-2-like [Aphis gossypii]|uniref:neprilysin-2-like n=1 Tax=Aphis gossypii TaxID=80765 RepID=UPI002159A46B|nr:neprilysin-2-like [Aphis gossypii]XP_050063549.1 neprilysin-2-like [Aphis gossypii]